MTTTNRTITIPFKTGTTAQNNAYKGNAGEITIDRTLRTLRIHDGIKVGGEALLRAQDLEDAKNQVIAAAVQPDWAMAVTTDKSYIKNKPNLGLYAPVASPAFTDNGSFTGNFTSYLGADGQILLSNGGIEIGKPGRLAGATTFVDFHSSANNHDYDTRIEATGGTATTGQGTINIIAANFQHGGYKVWTSNNDGVGSGLDADLLDGWQADETAANNTIVKRTSVGSIFVTDISVSSAQATRNTDTVFFSSASNYVLKNTAAGFKASLALNNVENKSSATIRSELTATDVTSKTGALVLASEKGANNGVATLDATGKVPAIQLPSYVDDVLEFTNFATFPATGETGKIFIAMDTNKQYRWSGSAYVEIVSAPGSTDSVAEGTTNKYFTENRVLAAILAGFSTATNAAVTAADSIIAALGKLQAQVTARALKGANSDITSLSGLTTALSIAQGGTNSTAVPTNGGVNYGTGTAHAFTPAGTSGQFLKSNGAAAPTWAATALGDLTDSWVKKQVRVGTTAALTVSATTSVLTNSGTLAALVIDGVTMAVNDRVLVKNQATVSQNGIYYVSAIGSASVAWTLTRATDADTASELAGANVYIDQGTQAGKFYNNKFKSTDTIGTTNMPWYEYTDAANFTWANLGGKPTGIPSEQATVVTNQDWNIFTTAGTYVVNNFAAGSNMPNNGTASIYGWGLLVVDTNGLLTTQSYYPHQGDLMVRSKYGASDWQPWRLYVQSNTTLPTAATIANYNRSGFYRYNDSAASMAPPWGYGNFVTINGGGDTYGQIYVDYNTGQMAVRGGVIGQAGTAWRVIPDSTGTNASGSWAINITGTAANTNSCSNAVNVTHWWQVQQQFVSKRNGYGVTAGGGFGTASLQVYANDNGPALISFLREGVYGVNFGLDSDSYLRIGGWSAGAMFSFGCPNGNFYAAGDITAFSDERRKKNWRPLPEGFIEQWAEVKHGTYDRIDVELTQTGLSAQSVQKILPHTITIENDEIQSLTLNYGAAAAVASVAAAKEIVLLKAQVVDQNRRLDEQAELINGLIEAIAQLQNKE